MLLRLYCGIGPVITTSFFTETAIVFPSTLIRHFSRRFLDFDIVILIMLIDISFSAVFTPFPKNLDYLSRTNRIFSNLFNCYY